MEIKTTKELDEQFPGVFNNCLRLSHGEEFYIREKDTIAYCLDKQKVKEILGNIKCDMSTLQGQETFKSILEIVKELGL